MSIFPNISLGRNTKRYTHNMSFDNNTTMPFGVVQPLMSQRLEANSKISVNLRQLVRLAPMPVPTFARLNMVNEVSFVPTVDVCPYYEALVSQMSYSNGTKTFYPTKLPSTSNASFIYFMLFHCDSLCSVYSAPASKQSNLYSTVSAIPAAVKSQFLSIFGNAASTTWLSQANYLGNGSKKLVTPDGADYIFYSHDVPNTSSSAALFCFRLSEKARRLRSVLLGLGYSLDPNDTSAVSLIPLLSYYKAWFDLYFPVRDLNWTDTNAYKLIKRIEDYEFSFSTSSASFQSFLTDCSNTFYVSKDDIVSVHRSSPNIVQSPALPANIYGHQNNTIAGDVQVSATKSPYILPTSYIGLTTLQALQRFSRYFNKNSVIGKRISSYLQVHYGASVANSLYKDSNHIGTYSFPLSVDDVMSTSDTFQTTADTTSGDMLGSYAGKGIGFDKSSFDFTAPTFGYFFVLSSISTPIGYFQGNSGDLYVTDFDSVPTPDYDALGYEVSPRGQFIGSSGNYLAPDNTSGSNPTEIRLGSGFGFVPRYTGLKYHKNIVSGDISRRSTADSLSAYHLNRIITPFRIKQEDLQGNSTNNYVLTWSFQRAAVPSASTDWRFLTKANWLGDYNRIFYNKGYLFPNDIDVDNDVFGIDDNFIVQSVFDVKVTNQYKPLSESWDTYEESTDNSSIDVRPE